MAGRPAPAAGAGCRGCRRRRRRSARRAAARAGLRPSRPSDPSGCRSSIGKAKGSPRLVLPRKVPPWRASAASSRAGSSVTASTGRSQQAQRAVADADGRPAVAVMGAQRHGADRGVEAGAVAAAGQDSDSLGHARASAPSLTNGPCDPENNRPRDQAAASAAVSRQRPQGAARALRRCRQSSLLGHRAQPRPRPARASRCAGISPTGPRHYVLWAIEEREEGDGAAPSA